MRSKLDRSKLMRRRRYYVYVKFRPNGIPCYVGKGQGYRAFMHEQWSGKYCSNAHLVAIIHAAGGNLPTVIVREYLTESEAFVTEVALIMSIGRADQGKGPLANHTDGGEGVTGFQGYCWTTPAGQVYKAPMPRSPLDIRGNLRFRGHTKTEEHRNKIGAGHLGKIVGLETRHKLAQAVIGSKWWSTPDGVSYMALEPRSEADLPGRISLMGMRWWTSSNGISYKAREPRDSADLPGRRSMLKETSLRVLEGV